MIHLSLWYKRQTHSLSIKHREVCWQLSVVAIIIINTDAITIAFQGDIITVISRVDENWAEGKLGDRTGIFPILFVEVRTMFWSYSGK